MHDTAYLETGGAAQNMSMADMLVLYAAAGWSWLRVAKMKQKEV